MKKLSEEQEGVVAGAGLIMSTVAPGLRAIAPLAAKLLKTIHVLIW